MLIMEDIKIGLSKFAMVCAEEEEEEEEKEKKSETKTKKKKEHYQQDYREYEDEK